MPAGSEPPSSPRRLDASRSPAGEALDDALIRAQCGDESGFGELWRALQPRLLRYLQVTNGDHCDDIAAETWLHVVRDLRSFVGNAHDFRAWLFTIARHRAIDAARLRASRPAIPMPDVAVATARVALASSAEDQALEEVSTRRALELVATLPAEQAEMVMLRVMAGLDVPVVARIVGKSPGAVRVSVHRALRALSRNVRAQSLEVS